MSDAPFLEIAGITASYGATPVLQGLDLPIRRGEFVALLGASGCGKSTLLRVVAGFVRPDAGTVSVGGRDVTTLPPDRRGMALVFQSYALWPHMTVAQNIGYGLKLRGLARTEIARRVGDIEDLLGLEGLGSRKPGALSGGQRQRVALGRALAVDPEILLLDEPLSNLDARIRLKVRHEIRALQRRLGITAVHVTHDREEAMVMADRVVVMDRGRIAQAGPPEEVFNHPASPFVAAFLGAENVLELAAEVAGDRIVLHPGGPQPRSTLPRDGRDLASGRIEARFRPDAAELVPAGPAGAESIGALELAGTVTAVAYPGGVWRHTVAAAGGEFLVDTRDRHPEGAAVRLRVPADRLFLFGRSGTTTAAAPTVLDVAGATPRRLAIPR